MICKYDTFSAMLLTVENSTSMHIDYELKFFQNTKYTLLVLCPVMLCIMFTWNFVIYDYHRFPISFIGVYPLKGIQKAQRQILS